MKTHSLLLPSPVAWGALFSSSSENRVSCLRDRDNDSVIRVMGKSVWNQAWETQCLAHTQTAVHAVWMNGWPQASCKWGFS